MPYYHTKDGTKLYYEEMGHGSDLVFIHGWSCSHLFLKRQIPIFAQNYHAVGYDLRGHGDSDRILLGLDLPTFVDDLKSLVEDRGLKNMVLIGWSMGAQIIWEYIKNYGCESIRKIALVDMTLPFIRKPLTR